MDDKRKWAFECFKKLGAPDTCHQIPLVKREVDHLPSKDALWNSNQSFQVDVRTSINFASASCKDLIVFEVVTRIQGSSIYLRGFS